MAGEGHYGHSGIVAGYPSEMSRVFSFIFASELCVQKGMFNLNENNRFVMSRNSMDLRKGVDSLCRYPFLPFGPVEW